MPGAINCSRWAQGSTSWPMCSHQPLLSLQMMDLGLLSLGAWVAEGGKSLGERAAGVQTRFLSDEQVWLGGRRESTKGGRQEAKHRLL